MTFKFIYDKGWRTGWTDRGGVSYLVKSFMEEFTSKDDIMLIIKVNMAYGTNIDKFMKELDIQNKDLPKLKFITDNLNYKDLVKFYNIGDVFVAPTRCEGFGLGMIQALACGIPILTTNFGGQTDFVNKDNGWLIGGELEEVKHEVLYEGISWLTPDIEELKKTMRWCYNNQDKVKEMKNNCLITANNYSWSNSANIAHNYLVE